MLTISLLNFLPLGVVVMFLAFLWLCGGIFDQNGCWRQTQVTTIEGGFIASGPRALETLVRHWLHQFRLTVTVG